MTVSRRKLLTGIGAVTGTAAWRAFSSPPSAGVIDVGAYCPGDGSTLDDDGLAKAMAALRPQGMVLRLPPRAIRISKPLVISSSRVSVIGWGPVSRILTPGDIDGIVIHAAQPLEDLLFSDFEIAAERPTEAMKGYGLRFASPNINYPEMRSITIRSKYGGIAFDPGGAKIANGNSVNAPRLENVNIRDCTAVGILGSYLLDLFMEGVHVSMRKGAPGPALWMSRWTQAVHARGVVCLGGEMSLLCENGGERSPSELRFQGCVFDGAEKACLQITKVARLRCSESWISSPHPGANGVVIEGGGADDVELSDVDILNTARFGLLAKEGSSGFRLLRSNVYNCSYEEKGKFDGIRIEKAVSDWKVEHCWIGNRKDYLGVQRYGIYVVDGPSDNYRIRGNTFSDNLAGSIYDGGTGDRKTVEKG